MKNVTITLPEEIARAARVAAARDDKSLSRWIADLLAEKMDRESDPLKGLDRWLSHPGYDSAGETIPSREMRNQRSRS